MSSWSLEGGSWPDAWWIWMMCIRSARVRKAASVETQLCASFLFCFLRVYKNNRYMAHLCTKNYTEPLYFYGLYQILLLLKENRVERRQQQQKTQCPGFSLIPILSTSSILVFFHVSFFILFSLILFFLLWFYYFVI